MSLGIRPLLARLIVYNRFSRTRYSHIFVKRRNLLPLSTAGANFHTSQTLSLNNKDYYSVLGVSRNSSQKEIKKAYYQLAKKYHPDVNKDDPGAARQFQAVSEAYEVLSDEEKRAEYDQFGTANQQQQHHQHHHQQQQQWGGGDNQGGFRRRQWSYQSNIDPEELFRQIFGDFQKFQNRAAGQQQFGGFGSIFEDFANFGFGRAQEAVVQLSFKEAAKGVTKTIDVVQGYGSTRYDAASCIHIGGQEGFDPSGGHERDPLQEFSS